jgi:hypothetical protein
LLLLILGGLLATVSVRQAHSFLAASAPLPDGLLVVEGWAPDYALEETLTVFRQGRYSRLFVSGGPLTQGAPLSEYRTHAELGAATLAKLGAVTNTLQAVPAPFVRQDRTYASAVALRNWLREQGGGRTNLTVISVGAHARRTRLLYEEAFGKEAKVGIIAVEPREYEPARWWRSSQGFRQVIDELIAYVYARLWFGKP